MSKSKKKSRKKTIKHFLNKAKYYNNAGQYKKAIANINLAYSIWEGYKKETSKTIKILGKIVDAKDIVAQNYTANLFNF